MADMFSVLPFSRRHFLLTGSYIVRGFTLSQAPPGGSTEGGQVPLQMTHRWYFWGLVATLLPLASLVLMVTKPKLW